MNTRQLEVFVNLAKSLNYSRTAEMVHLSQPAVSQQIKALEKELGVQLFARTQRSVELTAAGDTFYRDCIDILSRLDEAILRAQNQSHQFQSTLRVGASGNTIKLLDRILARYRKVQPSVHLHVVSTEPTDLDVMFGRKEVDVMFGSQPESAEAHRRYDYRELFTAQFTCLLSPDSPLSQKDFLTIDDLAGEDLIFLEKQNCPPEMVRVQDAIMHRVPEAAIYYSGSAGVSTIMIRAGMGIAVIPDCAIPICDDLVKVPMEGLERVSFGIVWDRFDVGDKIRAFIACAEEVYAEAREAQR